MRVLLVVALGNFLEPAAAFAQVQPSSTHPSSTVAGEANRDAEYATDLETVWIEGRAFRVEASDEFIASMSLELGNYSEGMFFIANNSTKPFTLDPASIEATAWKTTHRGPKKIRLYTYPADEYVNDIRSAANARKALLALSHGLQSAADQLSSGAQRGDEAVASSVQRLRETAERQERNQTADRIDRKVVVDSDGLMRKHTVFPGESYGGRVMFGSAKADSWEFKLKLGLKWFVFRFSSK